jgi:hypothetical protein
MPAFQTPNKKDQIQKVCVLHSACRLASDVTPTLQENFYIRSYAIPELFIFFSGHKAGTTPKHEDRTCIILLAIRCRSIVLTRRADLGHDLKAKPEATRLVEAIRVDINIVVFMLKSVQRRGKWKMCLVANNVNQE